MNNKTLEEIELFRFFTAPLSYATEQQALLEEQFRLMSQEEDISPKMAIAKVLSAYEHKIIFQLNCFSGCSYEERQLMDINEEFNVLCATYGLKEEFVWEGNAGRSSAVKAYNDWLNKQGFQAIYWIEELYDFMIFIAPKTEIPNILDFATKNEHIFQPVLASNDIPSYFHEVKEKENLKNLLEKTANKARKLNKHLFLYASMEECRPCCILDNSLLHPNLAEAFQDAYILKIDILEWMSETRLNFLDIMSVPLFTYITPEGKVTDHTLLGDAWGDQDTPTNMARVLKPYFKETRHSAKKFSQKEANEAISFAMELTEEIEHIKWMIEESNYDISHKEASLLYKSKFLEKNLDFAEYLLANGAYIESNHYNETPLIHAIVDQRFTYAKLLLSHGADINVRLPNGQTILFLLIDEFWYDDNSWNEDSTWDDDLLLNYLIFSVNHGADVNMKDHKGNGLLEYVKNFEATEGYQHEVVAYLQRNIVKV